MQRQPRPQVSLSTLQHRNSDVIPVSFPSSPRWGLLINATWNLRGRWGSGGKNLHLRAGEACRGARPLVGRFLAAPPGKKAPREISSCRRGRFRSSCVHVTAAWYSSHTQFYIVLVLRRCMGFLEVRCFLHFPDAVEVARADYLAPR